MSNLNLIYALGCFVAGAVIMTLVLTGGEYIAKHKEQTRLKHLRDVNRRLLSKLVKIIKTGMNQADVVFDIRFVMYPLDRAEDQLKAIGRELARQLYESGYEAEGDPVEVTIDPDGTHRIASWTACDPITRIIREAEREIERDKEIQEDK